MRNISNSEVTAWLTCRRQYGYAFVRGLTPKKTSLPLSRGTLGHGAFQRYIEGRLQGMSHEQALKYSQSVFTEAMSSLEASTVLETKFLYDRYQQFHNGWPEFELLGTEERHDLPLTSELSIPMRYDFKVRELKTGKVLVGDFKFAYDFWSPDDHTLNGQMPKYIQIMQNNGIEVHGGFLEEIRTRSLGKEKSADHKNLWRRTYYYPSIAKRTQVLRQHVAASLEIERFRSLPESEQQAEAIPVLNKHGACKYCNFKDLCASELDGKDITLDIQLGYVTNTYGYNHQVDELIVEDEL